MNFGKRLREARHHHHLSQEALGEALGISTQSISRWEREETVPQAHYRLQLSRFFGIHPQELFQDLERQEQKLSSSSDLWSVPYSRNPYFTGREEVLQQIHLMLRPPRATASRQPLAITGLGGIGKTQTVLEYAYRFFNDYHAVLWVRATTYDTLISDMVMLAQVLQLPEYADQEDLRIVETVKHWLRVHTHWLLILDDVEDLALIAQIDIPRENGSLLLTTRSQFTGILAQHIDLDVLSEDEGSLFLFQRSKLLPLHQSLKEASEVLIYRAREICRILKGLPLALDQAGAYIEESGCNLSDYLQRYKHQHLQLLKRRGIMEGDHPHSVATTMILAYEQIKHLNPIAMDILHLCTFLHPDDIPEEIIRAGIPALGMDMRSTAVASYQFDQAFVTLRSLSLVYRHAERDALCIHQLVQTVLRDTMEPEAVHQWIEQTVRAVNTVFPEEGPVRRPTYDRYVPHAQACKLLIEETGMLLPEAAQLFWRVGSYLLERGRYDESEQFLMRALTHYETLSEPASPECAKILNHLATLHVRQGEQAG